MLFNFPMLMTYTVCLYFMITNQANCIEDSFSSKLCSQEKMITKLVKYDKLYPYYIKYCATTKIHPKKDKGLSGTKAGHAIFYLKGVCKDTLKKPSGLTVCDKKANYHDPNTGVGISIDKGLKNSNFFVIPGLRFFLSGNYSFNQKFTDEKKNDIIKKSLIKKMFKGYEFHDFMLPKTLLTKHYEEFIANYTFGTDYALSTARNLYCINIPTTRSLMELVANNLNQLNESYAKSVRSKYRGYLTADKKKDPYYHWHGLFDNCTHTIINIFSELGILPPKKINQTLWKQLKHIAIPSNTLLNLNKKLNIEPINFKKYFSHKKKKSIFLTYDWINQQHGVLTEKINVYGKNEIYHEDDHLFVWPSLFERRTKKIRKLVRTKAYSKTANEYNGYQDNLCYYYKKYQKSLRKILTFTKEKKYIKNKEIIPFVKAFKTLIEKKQEEIRNIYQLVHDK